jgi:hypothetical protein
MKAALASAAAVLASASLAQTATAEARLTLSSGVSYYSGDYGRAVDTNVTSVPFSARLNSGPWTFRGSVSYREIDGPADVADDDAGGDAGAVTRTSTVRGIGDTFLSGSYTFRDLGGVDLYLELGGRVRLPTGDDDKGLGVGTTDWTALSEFGVSTRKGGAYVEVGRRFLGDIAGSDRQDGWQSTLGAWVRPGSKTTLGGSLYWREATFDGNDDPMDLGVYVSQRVSENWRIALSAGAGLSDASADSRVGLRFSWRSRLGEDEDEQPIDRSRSR